VSASLSNSSPGAAFVAALGSSGSGGAACNRSSRVEFLARISSARFILFESAQAISSRLICSVIGWRILSFSMKFKRIARIASISARIARSAAIVPASTDEPSSTSRTHSDSVNPAAAARDSSTRSSASETLVPTDFVRSARFTRHLRRSVFEGSAFVFQGSDARRPHGKRAASASRQAGC
jgi:hypothetical protein